MNIDEYLSHDAVALADLVARNDITAPELLQLACQRANSVAPHLNAIVRRFDQRAAARAADPRLQGPLAGVPFLLKDLGQEYKGLPCSSGSQALAAAAATTNAEVTQRFLDAGLVIFGHTNTAELGMKAVTEPRHWGYTRNPWNTRHTPGGSSGGSGAAVAAGIVPAAGANDGAGSIRIPAACNGLVGLKTSRGLTPNSQLPFYNGSNPLVLDALQVGATGWCTAAPNLRPKPCIDLYDVVRTGDLDTARMLYHEVKPLLEFIVAGGLSTTIKAGLDLLGLSAGDPRRPLLPLSHDGRLALAELLGKAPSVTLEESAELPTRRMYTE